MKVRPRILFGTALSALLATFVPAGPASSHTDVCVDIAEMTLNTGHGLPLFTSNTANFSIRAPLTCAFGRFDATGTITGACGVATGGGTTSTGHDFTLTVTGTTVVLTGEVYAVGLMVEDPLDAGSCTNKTATDFLIVSVFVLVH